MIKRLFSSTIINPITITNLAWHKMSEIAEKQKTSNFLFSAVSGGCNGFNYDLKLIDNTEYAKMSSSAHNSRTPISRMSLNNVTVLVDPLSEMFLIGTTIDYIKEDYSKGVFENKFVFVPDQTLASTCGCGISFTPKK